MHGRDLEVPAGKAGSPPTAVGAGRVLLICSHFFSYQDLIAEQFRRMGFEVIGWNDRASHATLYKFLLRKTPWLTGLATAGSFIARVRALAPDALEHIVIVKGEGLSRPVLAALRHRFPRARVSLFLWDAVANTRNSARIAPFAHQAATFDPEDARRYGWRYRPLFARPTGAADAAVDYDWSFIGTIHSDRARVIRRFRAALSPIRRGFVFGFFPSRLLRLAHMIRDPLLRQDDPRLLSLTPLPAAEAARIIAATRVVLDVEHPSQIGLTMRSIETLLSGRKLVTTNRTILDSALYHPSRVLVIDRANPVVPDAFFDVPCEPIPESVIYDYSLECWARETLGLAPAHRDAPAPFTPPAASAEG